MGGYLYIYVTVKIVFEITEMFRDHMKSQDSQS